MDNTLKNQQNFERPIINRINTTEKKKLFLGLAFLGLILILLLIGWLFGHKSSSSPLQTQNQTTQTQPNQTTLYFQPRQLTLSETAGGDYTFPIYIKSGTNQVSGVQIKMTYDPKLFTNVSITQKGLLEGGSVLLNKVDTVNGVINYAIGINSKAKPGSQNGILADLHFRLKPNLTVAPHLTSFAFIPGTVIGDQDYHFSTLAGAYGLVITLTK